MTFTVTLPDWPWYVWVVVWFWVSLLGSFCRALGRDLYDATPFGQARREERNRMLLLQMAAARAARTGRAGTRPDD